MNTPKECRSTFLGGRLVPDPQDVKWLYHETDVVNVVANQFFAIESQAFVFAATQVVSEISVEKLNMEGFPLFMIVNIYIYPQILT
jgi:hypothetical protein